MNHFVAIISEDTNKTKIMISDDKYWYVEEYVKKIINKRTNERSRDSSFTKFE